MNIKINIGVLVVALILLASCKDLDLAPTNRFTDENYWTSAEKAQLVLNDAFHSIANSGYFFYNEALSDNAYIGRGDSYDVKLISSGQHDPSTGRFSDEWSRHYGGIQTCHVLLGNIDRVPNINEDIRNRMVAECRFIRAYHYFQLTTWFGDVPFFDYSITLSESQTISRTSQEDVLDFIHEELVDIQQYLPSNSELDDSERGRITKGAVVAMNARVYLYSNEMRQVADECEKLMNGSEYGIYGLFSSYAGLFLSENEYNQEVIFDLQYVPVVSTYGELFDLVPLSAGARVNSMAPTQELVDDYIMMNGRAIGESGSNYDENDPYNNRDPRLKATIVHHLYEWENKNGEQHTVYIQPGSDPSGEGVDEYEAGSNKTGTGYYLRKYFDTDHETDMRSGLNLILMRYADILLMYVEAKNELNEMNAEVWNKTIRNLRERAGFIDSGALSYDSALSKEQMQRVIQRERRCELAMEGLRIFDLKRWGIAEDALNGHPHGAKFGEPTIDNGYIRLEQRVFDPAKDYLWPIPRSERDQNPNLDQNPNW